MKFIIGLILLFVGLVAAYQYGTIEYYTVTVESKERIATGSGDTLTHKYLVFTDVRVFENTDTIFYWKWDSSDIQGALKPGKQYRVKTYGWRVPFLSMYENIVSASDSQQHIAGN